MIWQARKTVSEWCYRERQTSHHQPSNPGLLFVKVPKTASSTLAGINIRIAHKVGERILPKDSSSSSVSFGGLRSVLLRRGNHQDGNAQVCSHTKTHGRDLLLLQRTKPLQKYRPLLWSFVRDPVARAQSAFFHFEVSRKGVKPTIGHLVSYARDESSNFQYQYLSTDANPKFFVEQNQDHKRDKIIQDQILKPYDFIGVVERWEESLAVMILLWNLQYSDVIVLPSKLAGGFDDGRYQTTGNCKLIATSSFSVQDQEYLAQFWNTTFRNANQYDYRLYEMVNDKLTKTIQALGPKRVEAVIYKLQELQALVQQQCTASAIFPCSTNGTWQYAESKKNCYWLDSGCGYPCIDEVFSNILKHDD